MAGGNHTASSNGHARGISIRRHVGSRLEGMGGRPCDTDLSSQSRVARCRSGSWRVLDHTEVSADQFPSGCMDFLGSYCFSSGVGGPGAYSTTVHEERRNVDRDVRSKIQIQFDLGHHHLLHFAACQKCWYCAPVSIDWSIANPLKYQAGMNALRGSCFINLFFLAGAGLFTIHVKILCWR